MTQITRRNVMDGRGSWDWPADLHPVLRQVFERRQLDSPAALELGLKSLLPVGRFDQLMPAVELLIVHRDSEILVVGDFDADGATSTALMLLTLRDLGFARVDFRIPDRFTEGYGLTQPLVDRLDASTGLIVTVDNGISSHEGIAQARARGFDVLVTDHHLPPAELPPASVIVNPNLPDSSFAGRSLAGVGVAFYLLAALGRALGQPGAVARYLDLVALGTVADLVRLDQPNRILVDQGLARIRAGQCRPGVRALLEAGGVVPRSTTTATLGFKLGPRLNAAGRLDDMSIGVRCLLTDDPQQAKDLAEKLDGLNRDRQVIEADMKAEAIAIVDALGLSGDELPPVICLQGESWHEGVVGLVASRIKEQFHRPCFAFAETAAGELKGSGRSIPGFHLRDALADVDRLNPGLILRFGGHAMAAGLSLEREALERFRPAIVDVASRALEVDMLQKRILSDGALDPNHLSLDVARLLRDAAPWGQGFPEPCFDDRFELVDRRTLKEIHLRLKLKPVAGGRIVNAIAFNQADAHWPVGQVRRIAYRLSVNDYFADESVQLVVEHVVTDSPSSMLS